MKKFSFINIVKLNKAPKKLNLLKQITLLSATVIVLIFSVFAWFLGGDGTAEATGIQVTMESGNSILISLNGGADFVTQIDLTSDADQAYISPENNILNMYMRDITSDGKTFYRPVFKDDNSTTNRLPDTTQSWDTAGETSYISENIVFRTASPSNIYLGENTLITTSAEGTGKLLTSSEPVNVGNMSEFGREETGYFSNDCITGALRLSAINSNNELVYVYIPRKDIEMTKTMVGTETYYWVRVTDDGSPASENSALHKYFKPLTEVDDNGNLYQETTSANVVGALGAANSAPIATTTLQENGWYEATATINIWLEGCDPETTRALSKGMYAISLEFTATTAE